MSSKEIEPDAYSFEQYFKMKTDSETRYIPKHPDEWIDEVVADVGVVPESIDKLFSAETIVQRHEAILQEEIEKHGRKPKTYRKAHERLLEELEEEVDQS